MVTALSGSQLAHTHLHDWHQEQDAKMASFAGFHMPLWYKAAVPEHLATRKAAGLFDVTHMGRVLITGPEATTYLDYILPTRIEKLRLNEGSYSVFCNEEGGLIDDLFLFRIAEQEYYMVVNASNRSKDLDWMNKHSTKFDVTISHISETTPMFAVQGPKAIEILQKLTSQDLVAVPRFHLIRTQLGGYEVLATRSGYTGEDGMEIAQLNVSLEEKNKAVDLWQQILKIGKPVGMVPVGLAARDTLRLEAGMVLYGNDITEETTPLEARLKFIVHLKKPHFLGKDALVTQNKTKPQRLRVGIIMMEKGIPRPGCPIFAKGRNIGKITSGSLSPLLRKGIALGYVERPFRKTETLVHVEIGNRKRWAEIIHPKRLLAYIKSNAVV